VGRIIAFERYALNHKYPNEMWVYAPAGRGYTVGVPRQPTGARFVLWCTLRHAVCFGRAVWISPVLRGDMCR